MSLIFDNPPVPSDLVDPKNLKLELLRAQDYESAGLTLHTATYDGNDILLDGSPLVTVANVKALDLTFDADDNALVVYTDTSDNVWLYDDDGAVTTDFSVTGEDPRIHNDRQASPNIVMSYRRGNDVFYRLKEAPDAGGEVWGPLPQGLNSGNTNTAFKGVAISGQVAVVVGSGGYCSRTDDGGVTWVALTQGLNSGNTAADFTSVATDGNGNWVAVAASGWAAGSTDNGVTWTTRPQGLGNTFITTAWGGVSAASDGVFVAVGSIGYCSISVDGGVTWTPLVQGLNSGSTSARFLTVANNGNGTWVAGAQSGWCAISTDNGVTWTALVRGLNNGISTTANIISLAAAQDGDDWLAVFSQGASAGSSDGALNWTSRPQGLNNGGILSTQIDACAAGGLGTFVTINNDAYTSRSGDGTSTFDTLPRGLNSGALNSPDDSIASNQQGLWIAVGTSGRASISPPLTT